MTLPLKLRFSFERETKNTIRYQELDDLGQPHEDLRDAIVGTVYIKKRALGAPPPQQLTLTLREE